MLIVLYILFGLIALVAAVLFIPVGLRMEYRQELTVRLRVFGIPILLFSSAEEEEQHTEQQKKKTAKHSPKDKPKSKTSSRLQTIRDSLSQSFHKDGLSATLSIIAETLELAGKAVGAFFKSVTIDRLWLEMRVSSEEPSDTAILYGRICGILYPALAALEKAIPIRRKKIRVEPNFLMSVSAVQWEVRAHIRSYQVLFYALKMLLTLKFKDGVENAVAKS